MHASSHTWATVQANDGEKKSQQSNHFRKSYHDQKKDIELVGVLWQTVGLSMRIWSNSGTK